jgi:hypothetical protein
MENKLINSRTDNVDKLRGIADNLDSDPLSEIKQILFPGWDKEIENDQELLIKEAAGAILANGISRDEGTYISQKSLAALIHYIADMME